MIKILIMLLFSCGPSKEGSTTTTRTTPYNAEQPQDNKWSYIEHTSLEELSGKDSPLKGFPKLKVDEKKAILHTLLNKPGIFKANINAGNIVKEDIFTLIFNFDQSDGNSPLIKKLVTTIEKVDGDIEWSLYTTLNLMQKSNNRALELLLRFEKSKMLLFGHIHYFYNNYPVPGLGTVIQKIYALYFKSSIPKKKIIDRTAVDLLLHLLVDPNAKIGPDHIILLSARLREFPEYSDSNIKKFLKSLALAVEPKLIQTPPQYPDNWMEYLSISAVLQQWMDIDVTFTSTMTRVECYMVLGLKEDAAADEIKQAYKTLILKHHPDKGGDKEKFIKVKEAYDKLTGN